MSKGLSLNVQYLLLHMKTEESFKTCSRIPILCSYRRTIDTIGW